jgi:trans-aconitate methyltransferase
MDTYSETFRSWDKVAQLYEDRFMPLELYNDTYDWFCDQLNLQHPKVLEIGCGPGNISRYLLSKRPDIHLEGIDVSPEMVKLAVKNNPSATFNVMDCRHISKMATTFDAIIGGFCIPYLSQPDCFQLIKDCNELLSESGIFYLSFVEGNYDQSGYVTGSSGDSMYFYYHNANDIRVGLQNNSFNVIYSADKFYRRSDETTEVHTVIIAQRHL